jgi:HAD superfamily hydrolase (TIGR01509 family)
MNIKAVIFDMDGLLINSEIYWKQFEAEMFPALGIAYTDQLKQDILGSNIIDITKIIQEKYDSNITYETIQSAFDGIASKVYASSEFMPGAKKLLDELKAAGVPMAIGSSACLPWIELCLDAMNIQDYFEVVCSTATMQLPGKPDPAVYNLCMEKLAVTPQEVVIFEDSHTGYMAALNSEAFVIAVPDSRWCSGDYSDAHLLADSLEDITLKKLNTLVIKNSVTI